MHIGGLFSFSFDLMIMMTWEETVKQLMMGPVLTTGLLHDTLLCLDFLDSHTIHRYSLLSTYIAIKIVHLSTIRIYI